MRNQQKTEAPAIFASDVWQGGSVVGARAIVDGLRGGPPLVESRLALRSRYRPSSSVNIASYPGNLDSAPSTRSLPVLEACGSSL
jgi:hypothetical protein